MGVQELSVWIKAGPEAVWRTYVDPRRVPEWQTGSPRIVEVDGGADEPGSTYVTKRGPTTAHTTVLSVEPHRLLVTRTRAILGLRFDVVSRLQPEADGTRLDLHVETRWPRGLGWAGRLVELVILSAAEGRKELGNLKALVEDEAGR